MIPDELTTPPERKTTGIDHADLQGSSVLVTGATGFLGSHLCAALTRRGARIHAVSRSAHAPDDAIRWYQSDLIDLDDVRRLLAAVHPDLIFHFSGLVTGTPELQTVRTSFDSLLGSAVNFLSAAAEIGCRRILLPGSMVEPEPGKTDVPPMSPYMAAKWAASAYARMFHALYRTPVVIVRVAYTYGPGQPDSRLLPYVIRSLLAGQRPRLSNGLFEGDWTYIDDMTDGILAAATAPAIEGLTIDLGTGKSTTAREVVELIVELLGTSVRPEFGVLPDRPSDRSRPADVDYARTTIGWTASTSLREGLLRTISWLKERPL